MTRDDEITGVGRPSERLRHNPAVKVERLPLSSEEYFVWTRVDGRTAIHEIILMSGFPPDKAITILRRLRGMGALLREGETQASVVATPAERRRPAMRNPHQGNRRRARAHVRLWPRGLDSARSARRTKLHRTHWRFRLHAAHPGRSTGHPPRHFPQTAANAVHRAAFGPADLCVPSRRGRRRPERECGSLVPRRHQYLALHRASERCANRSGRSSSNRKYAGCAAAAYSSARVPLGEIRVGSYVCVRTNEGRISQFRMNEISPTSPRTLSLGYTTWQ